MKFLLVFLAVFVSDCVWTFYIATVAQGKPFAAAFFSAFTVFLGLLATYIVVNSPLTIIPAVIAAFLGTYLTVWWTKEKK